MMRERGAGSEIGLQLLGLLACAALAFVIFAVVRFLFSAASDRPYQPPCSTITLSTPDGKPCFPKHHDRSRVRPANGTGVVDVEGKTGD